MEIVKTIITIIYFIISFAVIIIALTASKEDSALSSTITGSSTSNFYEKNKGKTREGKQKRLMITLSIIFAILTIALGILYLA